MLPKHEEHLKHIKSEVVSILDNKYRKGQSEHGGNLWEHQGLLEEAINEAIDQCTYLITLRDKLKQGYTIMQKQNRHHIYVSSPYSADSFEQKSHNTYKAIDIGIELFVKGYIPVIPHLSHFIDYRAKDMFGLDIPWEKWIEWDLELLEDCDYLFYNNPDNLSKGASIEYDYAQKLGIPIYTKLEEVPEINKTPVTLQLNSTTIDLGVMDELGTRYSTSK